MLSYFIVLTNYEKNKSFFSSLEEFMVLLEGSLFWFTGSPEVCVEESICLLESIECGFKEVTSCSSFTLTWSVTISNTSQLEYFLGCGGSNDTSTTRSRNESKNIYFKFIPNSNGSSLTGDFAWNGVRLSNLVTPITFPDWDEIQFSMNDSTFDGTLDFLGGFPSQTNVVFIVSDNNEGLESGSLSGCGLLLHGEDGEGFLLEFIFEEEIDDLELFKIWYM